MPIEHVVVLCLENRSFDHMLGFLDHPDPKFDGLKRGGPYDNAGWDGGPRVPATPEAKKVLPVGPDHSHDGVMRQLGLLRHGPPEPNDGFVVSYERKARGLAPARFGGLLGPILNWRQKRSQAATPTAPGSGPLVMLCQGQENVPVLSRLALDFAVCQRWFCSVPGETWPNRNYLHAATSAGETDIEIRAYDNPTIFELLEGKGASWRIYHDDTPQVWAFPALWDKPWRHKNWYPSTKFAEHAAAGDLPSYSFIEPNHRPPLHTLDHDPIIGHPDVSDSQHPENNLVSSTGYVTFDPRTDTDFARGEGLIATIYEALRANPDLFARTLLVITYDEHGGLYDHRPPPTGVPAPGGGRGLTGSILHFLWHRKAHRFNFTMLGPRVPTVLVSPLIEPGTLIDTEHDHASVPATLRALFAPEAEPLTRRDAWAATFHQVATRTVPRTELPDLSAYVPAPPSAAALAAALAPPPGDLGDAPEYYRDFIRQSDLVRKRLRRLGEPEVEDVTAPGAIGRAVQTSIAFQRAAHRHRGGSA